MENKTIIRNTEVMTVEKLVSTFPHKKSTINQQTVDLINTAVDDVTFDGYSFENSLIEYRKVMDRRSGSISDYINAVKFVAYLESGYTDIDAYRSAFAHRDLVKKSMGKKSTEPEYTNVLTSANRFKRSPMVVDIMTLSDVPMSIIHQGYRNEAVGVLRDEMFNARLPKDRIDAADKLLKNTPQAERTMSQIDIGFSEDAQSQIDKTNVQLHDIAMNQKKLFEQGLSIGEIQKIHMKKEEKAIDVEVDDE